MIKIHLTSEISLTQLITHQLTIFASSQNDQNKLVDKQTEIEASLLESYASLLESYFFNPPIVLKKIWRGGYPDPTDKDMKSLLITLTRIMDT